MIPSSSITMGNLRLSRQIATSEVQFLIKDERFVQKRPSDLSRSRSLLSSAPLFVEFHPGGEYVGDVEAGDYGNHTVRRLFFRVSVVASAVACAHATISRRDALACAQATAPSGNLIC